MLKQRSLEAIAARLQALPRWLLVALCLGLGAGIWLIDYQIRVDLGLSLFYLGPIALATWYVSDRFGMAMSGLAAIAWLMAATHTMPPLPLPILIWNTGIRLGFFVIVARLLASLHNAYTKEHYLARTDTLTGVMNRRAFFESLHQERQRSQRHPAPLTLAYLDVDNFKQVNDREGHAQGDSLLQDIGTILGQTLRAYDLAARLGGDEFAVLLPKTDQMQAKAVLFRLRDRLLERVKTQSTPVGFSIGVMTFLTVDTVDVDRMLEATDALMYRIKQDGKNRLEFEIYTDLQPGG